MLLIEPPLFGSIGAASGIGESRQTYVYIR
jgi:hypothetical protein